MWMCLPLQTEHRVALQRGVPQSATELSLIHHGASVLEASDAAERAAATAARSIGSR